MGQKLAIFQWQINTSKPVNISILFPCKISQLLVYNMFCLQFDTNLTLSPWTNIHPLYLQNLNLILFLICFIGDNSLLHTGSWYIPTHAYSYIYMCIHTYTFILTYMLCTYACKNICVHIHIGWFISNNCVLHLIK